MRRWVLVLALILGASKAMAVTVSEAGEWTTAGAPAPYTDANDIQVDSGKTLTIDPGVVVRLGSGRSLTVNGTLIVNGTASQPVTFTASNTATPWGRIQFSSGSSGVLKQAVVQYATGTYAAVQISAASVTVSNSTFANDSRYGVSVDSAVASADQTIAIQGSTFRSNGGVNILSAHATDALSITGNDFTGITGGATYSPVRIVTGALPAFSPSAGLFTGNTPSDTFDISSLSPFSKDVTLWHTLNVLAGSGGVNVQAGKTLSMQAGASIRFQAGQALAVSGTLNAAGTAANPVVFTSPAGTAGAWDGITLAQGASATLSHAAILYGGTEGSSGAGLSADRATVTLDAVEIAHSAGVGVSFQDSETATHTLSIQNSAFHDNGGYGVRIEGVNAGDTALIANNTFALNAGNIAVYAASLPVFNGGPNQVAGNTTKDPATGVVTTGDILTILSDTSSDRVLPDGLTLWEQVSNGYNLSVPGGSVVALEGGSALHMGNQASVDVTGTLNVLGRTANGNGAAGPVVTFDGGSKTAAAGTWGGILFHPGAHGSLTGVIMRDGGANGATVSVDGATVSLTQCGVLNGGGAGILLSGAPTFAVTSSLITTQAGPGIRDTSTGGTRTAGNAADSGCDIYGNGTATGATYQFEATANVDTLAARFNYWGAAAGPYNATLNPDGSPAHKVSDHVDFQNFAAAPVTAPVARLDNIGSAAEGTVPLYGEAYSPLLDTWTLSYAVGDNPAAASYVSIAAGHNSVLSGKLADWNTAGLNPHIRYTVHLVVQDVLGRTSDVYAVTRTPLGDVNGNGTVDLADAVLALRFALGQSAPVGGQLIAADVRPAPTPDGKITQADAIAILQTVGGLHGNLP